MKQTLQYLYKTLLLISFCISILNNSIAQAPANDNCGGAILLTSSTSCSPVTGTFIRATKTATPPWVMGYTANNTFNCPAGVKSLVVDCWGAGGAGGGATGNNAKGGGGGGGAYTYDNTIFGTTGSYAINVGIGGNGGNANGAAGTASTFGTVVMANGGAGGAGAAAANGVGAGGAGAIGGTFNGGNGSNGNNAPNRSGAGGGGAGSGGSGGNAIGITGGLGGAIDGGAGAAGRNTDGVGNNGIAYGGGGSGALKTGGTNRDGGDGANGFVRLSMSGDANSPDVWYRFMATSTSPTIVLSNIDTDAANKQLTIHLLSGTCAGPLTTLFSETTNRLVTNGLTINTTYFIRITTNTNFVSPTTGAYTFDICVQNALTQPLNNIDFSKSYVNVSDRSVGGTINQNDILEIRATLVVRAGAGTISNVSYYDTLKRNAGFIFVDSIATRTNEGKNFATFTPNNVGDDPGWKAVIANPARDTSIQINIGTGASATTGGSLDNTSLPAFGSNCIIIATYRVRVDSGTVGYGRKINYGGGAFRYTLGGTVFTIAFPRDSLIIYPTLNACSDAVAPANLIGSANNGNFGTLANGTSASGTQNGGPAAINTTYIYETYTTGPNDYYYGIVNNTSKTNAIDQTAPKGNNSPTRVFDKWDITGDHTGATNTARGNKPCNPNLPVSATNPCGYMLTVNSSYRSDKVFEYTASGVCAETYYEVSAWFKNLCIRCGADVNGTSSGSSGYIPTAPNDSAGVRPNIAMQIDGIDYYTTGEIRHLGLFSNNSASDTLNNWVRRSFVFKTGPNQTSFKVTFRNNAPGGGGNDWAVDDIGLRTCFPTMVYAPENPIVFVGDTLTITDTVRSYFDSYTFYKWQRKPITGPWADVVPASTGMATPVFNPTFGQFEYVIAYTIPGTATQTANTGDAYRMIVASSAANLNNGCSFVPNTTFTLVLADAPCVIADTNYAITPQTGKINWNDLDWSLGHIPTCCESVQITYTGTNTSADAITVNITNDICIRNLTLINAATSSSNKLFKTNLFNSFKMLMNGNVRMKADGALINDSCIFIGNGNNTITITGNTRIGYVGDRGFSIIGSAPGTVAPITYILKGDSLTFNAKGLTSDRFITMVMNPTVDTAYLVNNTSIMPYPNAVTFEGYKIGDGVKATTVITGGSNQNSYMNNRGGALEVTTNGTLVLPANYTINARGSTFNSSVLLRTNSTLRIGGYTGGTTGSNFPANFTLYNAHPQSLVEYYGNNSNPQTVYGTTYGKLELRNGTNALGTGRAQKNSIAPIISTTSINVNRQTDFTLGTLGSSTQPVVAVGTFNVTDGAGLYCNANVISGAGIFTLGDFSFLGMGHALGITTLGNAIGNLQMTGSRNLNTKGNYIYNGLVNQITGNGLPSIVNDLTTDNPGTVTIALNQIVNGVDSLKQGVFDIGTTKITHEGPNSRLNSIGGKMKANRGIVEMKGTSGSTQNLSGSWFVNKTISTLINANTRGITVAPPGADSLLIASALLYGSNTNSNINTGNNLTLLSRDTATARFGEMINGNTITGTVTVERWLPTERKWRLLAWPTESTQTAQQSWMENSTTANDNLKPGYGTIITDEQASWASGNFDSRSVSGPSVKYFDMALNKYIGIPNTRTYQMNTNSAYYAFTRGDRTCLPANGNLSTTILRTTGTLKTGDKPFIVPATRFMPIGNPYASAIDIRKLDTLNLTSTIYVWDPKLTGIFGIGAYQTLYKSGNDYRVMPGGGTYGALNSLVDTLESGQAFFVRARASAGTLTFKETAKNVGARALSFTGNNEPKEEAIFALLNLVVNGEKNLVDGTMATFDELGNNDIDFDDALKLDNLSENVSIKTKGQSLSIDRRKPIADNDTLHLNLTGVRLASYAWDISSTHLKADGRKAYLVDSYLKTEKQLSFDENNIVPFDITNAPAAYAANRFFIVFKQEKIAPLKFINLNANRKTDKAVMVEWQMENEKNVHTYTLQQSNDGRLFTDMYSQMPTANNGGKPSYNYNDAAATINENYYRVKATMVNAAVSFSSIIKVDAVTKIEKAGISIYPNPVKDGIITINFVNKNAGMYGLKVKNVAGQTIYSEKISIQNNNHQKQIKIANAAKGIYQLVITNSNKKEQTMSFVVE